MAVYEGVNASRSKSTDAKHIITVLASRMMLFFGVNLLYYGGKQRLLTNQPENNLRNTHSPILFTWLCHRGVLSVSAKTSA